MGKEHIKYDFFYCLSLPEKDEEGRSGPFVDKIREQEKLEKTMYIKDIESALGGSRQVLPLNVKVYHFTWPQTHKLRLVNEVTPGRNLAIFG